MSSPSVQHAVPRQPMTILASATLATLLAGSSVPTPLYHLYQQAWHLSALTLTTIFAAYALSLIVSLLLVGSLSDHVGRRPVIFCSVLLGVVAMLLFATATSAAVLVVARIVQGLSTGAAIGALGAAILDTDRRHGPMINSVAPFLGLGVGAFGSAVLATYAPAPTHLVYLVVGGLLLLEAILVLAQDETAEIRPGAMASLWPHLAVPPQARGTLLLITPGNIAVWALSGFYFSLMPSLVQSATGTSSPLVGGIVVATLALSAAGAVLGMRTWPPRRVLAIGTATLATGVAVTLGGVYLRSVSLLLPGTMIAGIGLGCGFSGAARSLLPLAEPDERAGLLSTFYAQSYLSFSLPAIAIGTVARHVGLVDASYLYGAVVIVLAAMSFVGSLRRTPFGTGAAIASGQETQTVEVRQAVQGVRGAL